MPSASPSTKTSCFFHIHDSTVYDSHEVCKSCNPKLCFSSNYIITKRYNKWNAIPFALFKQLKKVANIYFLLMALFALIPATPLSPVFAFCPVIIVISLSMLKDILNDYSRHKLDKEINNQRTRVLKTEGEVLEETHWKKLIPGDLVLIKENETFPADLLLLSSSSKSGIANIETASFDGETNLKVKQANLLLLDLMERNLKTQAKGGDLAPRLREMTGRLKAVIESSPPNKNLDSSGWKGQVLLSDSQETAPINFSYAQFVPRSCVLRNTSWIFGMVMFTGKETKVSLNSTPTKSKTSTIERLTEKLVMVLILVLVLMASSILIGNIVWTNKNYETHWYMSHGPAANLIKLSFLDRFLQFASLMVMFQFLVPVSLYIVIEMVKSIQTLFIKFDLSMYDKERDILPGVNTYNLNEDLGRIRHVFSDKTGTLTENKMFFKALSISGEKFGNMEYSPGVKQKLPCEKYYHIFDSLISKEDRFDDMSFFERLENEGEGNELFDLYMVCSATCHSVLATVTQDNEIDYQSTSPDEISLVNFCAKYGYYFYGRNNEVVALGEKKVDGEMLLVNILGKQHVFELVTTIDFSSDRKRMSVVVRDPRKPGKVFVFMKGADSVIYNSLDAETGQQEEFERNRENINNFAQNGLRTLCMSYKEVEEAAFVDWLGKYEQCKGKVDVNEEELSAMEQELESKMKMLGVTAIEDSLQPGVAQCITKMREAGIKVWVLTGDKVETALNIGRSAGVISRPEEEELELEEQEKDSGRSQFFFLDGDLETISAQGLEASLIYMQGSLEKEYEEQKNCSHKRYCVMTGLSMDVLFPVKNQIEEIDAKQKKGMPKLKEVQKLFYKVAMNCESIICCRASPKQKQSMVSFVTKEADCVTLAIGDGTNDVPMIKEASIGVGISGLEGTEAANSSDFSIGQFRFLNSLLFVHGNWNYRRVSKVLTYFFYKNSLIIFINFFFCFINGFSGTLFSESSYTSYYNLFFTNLTVFYLGIFDSEFSKQAALENPHLYKLGQKNIYCNIKRFVISLFWAFYHSFVIFIFTVVVFNYPTTDDGFSNGLPMATTAATNLIIIMANIYVLLETRNWNAMLFVTAFGSILVWGVYLFLFSGSALASLQFYWVGMKLIKSGMFYSYTIAVLNVCLLPLYLYKFFMRVYYPNENDIIQEREVRNLHKHTSIHEKIQKGFGFRQIRLKKQTPSVHWDMGYVPFAESGKTIRDLVK